MLRFDRSDRSALARWSREVDWWLMACILGLVAVGILLTLTASPAVAERLGLGSFHFAKRQFIFLIMGLFIIIATSLFSTAMIRRAAIIAFPILLVLLGLTLFIGPEYKGATRWLQIGSFTLQPSEFMKPIFIVVTAWVLSADLKEQNIPAKPLSFILYLSLVFLLVNQPDYGQTMLVTMVWLGQMALAGLPLIWLGAAGVTSLIGLYLAYIFVPHVTSRINNFLDPASGDTYQTDQAMRAFESGGFFGRGPGEGSVKLNLPDAHTDYIFAVVGEEFGTIACLAILALFAGIVFRGLSRLIEEENPFVMLAASGLLLQFGIQAVINVGVNLALLPSKGMTLPFISYGGSSMLALALGMGMVLALTRNRENIQYERAVMFRDR